MTIHENQAQGMNIDAGTMSTASLPSAAGGASAPAAKAEAHGITFHELLADLNPLQHIPVVGTIYRAITGDEIPDTARNIGSLVVGGIMGGPMGLVGNIALLAFRKLTGIDVDRIGQDLLADIGIGHHTATSSDGAAAPAVLSAAPEEPKQQNAGMRTTAWSVAQLGRASDLYGLLS